MTFTEAAAEILRLVGRPLHYKKITELAIERNLLSHVGKAPELTMSSRLATIVKKDRSEGGIVKVKPGVFALRSFSKAALALADSAEDVDLSQLPPPEATPPAPSEPRIAADGTSELRRLPGADVFPVEEDDDRPILADLNEPSEKDSEGDSEEGRKGRRRRRRRGRKDDDMSEPTENGDGPREAAPVEGAAAEGGANQEPERRDGREGGGERADRGDRGERADRGGRDRDRGRGRDRDRHGGGRDFRDGGRDGARDARDGGRDGRDHGGRDRDGGRRFAPGGRDAGRAPDVDLSREPADGDLLGKDLADACYLVLAQSEAMPVSYAELARMLVARGRLSGDPAALAPTVAAAVRAETARGESGRMGRARFRHVAGAVALTSWYYPREVVHRERDSMRAIERYVSELRRGFLRKLGDLPAGGFAELLATWLNSQGVGSLRGVRRPTSSGTEMHFAGVRRRGPEEVRIGIVVFRGSLEGPARDVGRERVTEARGSAHHYGAATELWIVTTGPVQSGAREEAAAPATVPVALFDGMSLAESMEQARIGLVPVPVMVPSIDLELFDSLRGSIELPARDREPPMREHRERGQGEGPRNEPRPDPEPKPEGDAAEPVEGGAPQPRDAKVEGEAEGEGGRRRRRRRRRRGGRDADAPGAAASQTGEGSSGDGGGAEGDDSDDDEGEGEGESQESPDTSVSPAPTGEAEQPSDSEDDDSDPSVSDSEDDE